MHNVPGATKLLCIADWDQALTVILVPFTAAHVAGGPSICPSLYWTLAKGKGSKNSCIFSEGANYKFARNTCNSNNASPSRWLTKRQLRVGGYMDYKPVEATLRLWGRVAYNMPRLLPVTAHLVHCHCLNGHVCHVCDASESFSSEPVSVKPLKVIQGL